MRIISTFHDFYDGVQRHDEERTLIFHRRIEEIHFKKKQTQEYWTGSNYKRQYWNYRSKMVYMDHGVIGFCGNVYPFVNIGKEFIYNLDELKDYLVKNYREKQWESFYKKYGDHERLVKNWNGPTIEFKQPIYLLKGSTLTYNPQLKDYNFQKIKPPYEAYQELCMYLSNQANPEKPIPSVSDKDMIEAKGFTKYSFRKDKNGEK